MDAGPQQDRHRTFVRLYNEGLIYRGKRLVNWDPKLHTAVSDLEVVRRKKTASWHIRYPAKADRHLQGPDRRHHPPRKPCSATWP